MRSASTMRALLFPEKSRGGGQKIPLGILHPDQGLQPHALLVGWAENGLKDGRKPKAFKAGAPAALTLKKVVRNVGNLHGFRGKIRVIQLYNGVHPGLLGILCGPEAPDHGLDFHSKKGKAFRLFANLAAGGLHAADRLIHLTHIPAYPIHLLGG